MFVVSSLAVKLTGSDLLSATAVVSSEQINDYLLIESTFVQIDTADNNAVVRFCTLFRVSDEYRTFWHTNSRPLCLTML